MRLQEAMATSDDGEEPALEEEGEEDEEEGEATSLAASHPGNPCCPDAATGGHGHVGRR